MKLRIEIINEDKNNPITINDAKAWLQVDYPDFDDLINSLLDASIARSQKMSGTSFWPVTVKVSNNKIQEYIYPIQPIIEEAEEGASYANYTYRAGFEVLPDDLKRAVLQRVATGFSERQNGYDYAISKATETSLIVEMAYREDLYL